MKKGTVKRMAVSGAVFLAFFIMLRVLFEVGVIPTLEELYRCQQSVVGVALGTFIVLVYFGFKDR